MLAGRTIVAFSGIGSPGSFGMLLRRMGVTVGVEMIFTDHHDYHAVDLESVRDRARQSGADLIVTTEKDAGKVAPLLEAGEQVWAVRIGLEIVSGREPFERMMFGEAEPAPALTVAHA